MEFGECPVAEAAGGILAHSLRAGGVLWKKGIKLDAAACLALEQAGIVRVTIARLGPGDVDENNAAARLAAALVPDPDQARLQIGVAATGRVNLNATVPGIVALDAAAIAALNLVHPAITLATLAPMTRVGPRTLTGTVKIIAYGVPEADLERACAAVRQVAGGALRILPVVRRSAGLILTHVPGQKPGLNAKARDVVQGRLTALGMTLEDVVEVPHSRDAITGALGALKGEVALILTGSATSDLHDVGPEALRHAGGRVARFGMPVDPGNLLFLGDLPGGASGPRPVIGLPGCARSPALNGADWVLERIACGLEVSDADIAAMGVGGLLKEIPIRPRLREP